MEFLLGLLLIVLFLKIFVNISVGLFKLLIGIIIATALFSFLPLGFLAIGLLIPIIVVACIIGFIGFLLKIIF